MSILLLVLQVIGIGEPTPDPDFMRHTMPRPHGGDITMTFFVDPDGRVFECEVLTPRVSNERAEEYCEQTIGERLGDPATDPDGRPAYGTITLSVLRRASPVSPPRLPPLDNSRIADLEILVTQMPGDKKREAVSLIVYIDATGRVQGCRQMPGRDFEFSNDACSQAIAHTFDVRRGVDGQPVGHVDVIRVDFVLEQPPT